MVRPLLSLSAWAVVSDHYSFVERLRCIPCKLYRPLLDAAVSHFCPLAIVELVQRWPERTLSIRRQKSCDHEPPDHLCDLALLLAMYRGLTDKRCCLQVLDLCGLHFEDGPLGNPKYKMFLTTALCYMLLQAKKKEDENTMNCSNEVCKQFNTKGMSRKMELQRRTEAKPEQIRSRETILVDIIANLFVDTQTWFRVHSALRLPGPLCLYCRFLHVEDLAVSSIISLLHLIPKRELLSLNVCNSSMGVSGLVLLLPQLTLFPQLCSLGLHYCNLDTLPSKQEMLQDLSRGFRELKNLRRLSLIGLHLPGLLFLMLSSLSEPLEVLGLMDFNLNYDDIAYLSRSPHASSLAQLNLSDNRIDASSLLSLHHFLAQAKYSLKHLSLCSCGLLDGYLGRMLPSLGQCRALRSLRLALNPLSRAALVQLVQAVTGIHSLRLLLYPKPLEEYQPGLPAVPSSAQLLDWPLLKDLEAKEATLTQLDEVLRATGRTQDLLLTSNHLKYGTGIEMDD